MCKYEDTERTRFCPQTDRRTRWYQYTPFQLRWSGGYNYPSADHGWQNTCWTSKPPLCNPVYNEEREREIKFIGLFENRGHRGPYSPYKPFNHNLYIGIIIFPHIDNPQYTGYDLPKKKPNKIINAKKVRAPLIWQSLFTMKKMKPNSSLVQ